MELVIRLNKDLATVISTTLATETEPAVITYDWVPALIAAATEVQALNQFAGTEDFPRPIPSNPEAMKWVPETEGVPAHWEGDVKNFLGLFNTPPDDKGFVTIAIDYEYLDLGLLPAQPQTFTFVMGQPSTVGRMI